jgi:hypothetical protein
VRTRRRQIRDRSITRRKEYDKYYEYEDKGVTSGNVGKGKAEEEEYEEE